MRKHATRLPAKDSARNPDRRRLGEAARQRQHQEPAPVTGDLARGRGPEMDPEDRRHAVRAAILASAIQRVAGSYVLATTSLVGAAATARNAGTCM